VRVRLLACLALLVPLAVAAALLARGGGAAPAKWTAHSMPTGTFLHATPGTLDNVFAGARAGDTIILAGGRYGRFAGGMKTGTVTLEAAPGATATMAVDFNPARNIVLDGLKITSLLIADRRSRNLTVRNSRFEGAQAVLRTADLSNANILFDHNTHAGYDKCDSCYEGRLQLAGRTEQPSGVTIRDSVFGPGGNSDGIQNGGRGVRILHNRFFAVHQVDGAAGVHADAIQLYGSAGTVIRGNRMVDVASGIMAPDGADHEVIEDNVIQTDGNPYAITLGGDRGSVIRHNTLPGGRCHWELPCGTLRIFAGNDGGGSSGTVVEDNVLGALAIQDAATLASDHGNTVGRGS
jgi:hypothetical protein